MDFIRTAYSTTVHFKDLDPRVSTITWYKAPTGALAFPDHHYFGSLNYTDRNSGTNPVGEIVGALRPWSNGATPAGILGTNFCGAAADYLGITAFRSTPMPLNSFGQPTCCDAPFCVEFDTFRRARTLTHTGGSEVYWLELDNPVFGQYKWHLSTDASKGFAWKASGTNCPSGIGASALVSYTGGDPTTGVACLQTSSADRNSASTWLVPGTAPYLPGATIAIAAPAAPARVQSQKAGGATPLHLTWPAATTLGNFLWASFKHNGTTAASSVPAGWTILSNQILGGGVVVTAFKKYAASESVSGNFGGGTLGALILAEYRNQARPVRSLLQASTGFSATIATANVGPSGRQNELALATFSGGVLGTYSAPTNGFLLAQQVNAAVPTLALSDKAVSGSSTFQSSLTYTSVNSWGAMIETF
jgi:hypothetical protein